MPPSKRMDVEGSSTCFCTGTIFVGKMGTRKDVDVAVCDHCGLIYRPQMIRDRSDYKTWLPTVKNSSDPRVLSTTPVIPLKGHGD